ncbi:hypothetical protein QMG61_13620 [Cryobacterium sp. PH31-AA6]|uniref:hypothetical protein n=1 Tax=Cryobacterium sp. PH31-AA6 TaxID=3046205 RepID=UPI0024B89B58|nr:hypothetical protein [Cryobacterium sp. PH31-AA6]MDJ0324796.1 hypothetical protein [Cryobacterium sp. PH31-AA6]
MVELVETLADAQPGPVVELVETLADAQPGPVVEPVETLRVSLARWSSPSRP